jgi:hypothetical protein
MISQHPRQQGDRDMPFWRDNVRRKDEFLQKHPEWAIEFSKERRQFEAVNTKEDGFTLVDSELGHLMDKLETMQASEDA